MNPTPNDDELRLLVRRALLDMLQEQGGWSPGENEHARPFATRPAPERTLTVTLHGSERSIGLLEAALAREDTSLEIALGSQWGPKMRVRAERPERQQPCYDSARLSEGN